MSQHTPAATLPGDDLADKRIAIVRARWNDRFTAPLTRQAVERLADLGVNEVHTFEVPGAVELTFAASQLIEAELADAIVVIGCVVRGDTPHFDYVCQSVTQGITGLNADCETPIIFGLLTVDNDAQAAERVEAGKGAEWAEAAVDMIRFQAAVIDAAAGQS